MIEILETTDSTQTYLKKILTQKGFIKDYYVLALSQNKGYGRLGSPWFSQKDKSFILSFSFSFPNKAEQGHIVFFIALVVSRVLEKYEVPCKIKWPNDIYIDYCKIAGILVESFLDGFIVGIGLNLNQDTFPLYLKDQAISLYQITGEKVTPQEFFDYFRKELNQLFLEWDEGFIKPIHEINKLLLWKGEQVKLDHGDDTQIGTLIGLNEESGAIILKYNNNEIGEYRVGRLRKI